MPLFAPSGSELATVPQANFKVEKELQNLIERNLQTIFNCRFVATEFSTGSLHSGRIDTLALSEDRNPVIIEYKKVESSDLINQSLYYLHWIQDHKGDFEIAAKRTLGNDTEVDWSDVRVICLAPNYKKYDLHAVEVMGANIELWKYRRFQNGMLFIEEVYQRVHAGAGKDPTMVAAGKKAAATAATASYTFEEHLEGKPERIRKLAEAVREFVLGLDSAVEEAPKKFYVAYRSAQNIACVEIQKRKLNVFVKLAPEDVPEPRPSTYRDVTRIGHFGTGDTEFTVASEEDLEVAMPYIELSYQKVGG
jgi:predicted transport protein